MTTLLLTGASSGLGLALARQHLHAGFRLVLVGRRALGDLPADAPEGLFTEGTWCRADLSDPAAAAPAVGHWLRARGIQRLDRVVHAAGVGRYGLPDTEDRDAIRDLLAVNLEAPIRLTRALWPWLAGGRSQVVFISSVVADLPAAEMATYAASKAAVSGFARSLAAEAPPGVQVQALHPGGVATDMHRKAGVPEDLRGRWSFPAPDAVAGVLMRQMRGRRRAPTVGWGNALARTLGRRLGGAMDALARRRRSVRRVVAHGPERPRALVTGAADGIGRCTADRLARTHDIVALDLDAERAEAAVAVWARDGGNHVTCPVDLADRAAVDAWIASQEDASPFQVLVHAAGISQVGRFHEGDPEEMSRVLRVNLESPLVLTAGLLAADCIRDGGSIVVLSSLSHHVGYPGASVYAATKDGVAAYARCLGVALADRSIHTLRVFPGPTRTAHAERYAPPGSNAAKRMPPEQVAEAIVRALRHRRAVCIPGLSNRMAARLGRLAPRTMERIMRRVILDRMPPAASAPDTD